MKKISLLCFAILLSISMMAQNTANLKMNLEKNKVYRLKVCFGANCHPNDKRGSANHGIKSQLYFLDEND